ncbi:hypothetical protein AMES_6071 [Amycolatopsis mediterranei S699]|uniref:Uncharacterized protein n=2 Tax=Amycolatopsis mediterranei TaxID=33910 RepID=A0A0H3DB74_AMYMU|nr:hypothetical protein [Amycolatopsis mediterranei]ADJ47896.1 hypothetical protein AMED_6160 [Amycolatopsis mediterranei U32]AEK44791.1 hypothetical protein RAM_31580 [Amycolatopsis mediterranei S699]AFO79607.1 hypothetical protein AMES_6071 [Amycolatopsis mediterranei S699]AGT86735.1 hypothetical protein B737_6071 [Amycolatopsis mediterranei RB]UZF72903.1 hypothetical protein ISP_006300 [Amycolatopsis mediterranei]
MPEFLPAPDPAATDMYACLRVHTPTVLTDPSGAIVAVGVTRPAVAAAMIRAAAPGLQLPAPDRADAQTFRLRWFAYTHPGKPGDPVLRPAGPGEDGAFPVVIWRAADQTRARATRDAAHALTVMGVAA